MVSVPISRPDIKASSQFLVVSEWDCCFQVPNGKSELSRLKKHNKVLLLILFTSILFMSRIMNNREFFVVVDTFITRDKSSTGVPLTTAAQLLLK